MSVSNRLAFPNSGNGADGLTKREYFAAAIMAALRSRADCGSVACEKIAAWAIADADALVAELAKPEGGK